MSDRTIQTILRQLEKDGLIEIIPRHDKTGRQKRNAYKYIGPSCKSYGTGLTLKALYSTDQDVGFRDWAWKTHGFDHDQTWHNIYPMCKVKFERRMARKAYLEENGLPLIVPEDNKYIVLRYCLDTSGGCAARQAHARADPKKLDEKPRRAEQGGRR